MNFKGLTKFDKENYLSGDNGIVVFLESTDDVFIFKKWFSHLLDRIQFEPISGKKSDGGCDAIINHFSNLDINTETHFGVIDRDALLRNLENHEELWWQIDDDLFYSEQPFGNKIFILNRWELENYLLHSEAIAQRIRNKSMGEISYSNKGMAQKILAAENDLIAITVLSTLGRGDRSEKYAQTLSGDKLRNQVKKEVTDENLFPQHEQSIIDFTENCHDPIERWERLSRMLDGKRIMNRISGLFHDTSLGKKFSLKEERGDLADVIFNEGLVDKKLKSWIHSIA